MTATVKINSNVQSRNVTTKNGPKTIHYQAAEVETEHLRMQVEVEVDGPNMGYPVGSTREWDVIADLVPGRYGLELARRMTLREANAPKLQAAK